jgi:hypothetical protein
MTHEFIVPVHPDADPALPLAFPHTTPELMEAQEELELPLIMAVALPVASAAAFVMQIAFTEVEPQLVVEVEPGEEAPTIAERLPIGSEPRVTGVGAELSGSVGSLSAATGK